MSVIVNTAVVIMFVFLAHSGLLRATKGTQHKIALWYGYLMYPAVAVACVIGCCYGWKYGWKEEIDTMIFLGSISVFYLLAMNK